MNTEFFPCRTSSISKLGRFSALYFYPSIGIVLLYVAFVIGVEVSINNDYTVEQFIILLLTVIIAILSSSFLFIISQKCYCMETRHIAIDDNGFIIREKTDIWYAWKTIGGIGVVAYAANASKQNYQTQICIFLEPISDVALRKLRDSYLHGAFNHNKYVLLDYHPLTLNKLAVCSGLPLVDFRPKQLKL